ncbi:MAG: N-acetyltransferase [Planctomycetota bacterium]
MKSVEVTPVEGRKDRKEFMELIWRLYKSDRHWIPPIRMNQEELVGFRKHPFYEKNTCQAFLARRDGQVVGRIVGIINHAHNKRYEEKRGFFGFFEAIDDQQVANALFEAAGKYLKSQGMTDVRGPCNPSLNYETGTLVDGFDSSPTVMMTYNPPYHDRLIRGFGFEKTQDMYAYNGNVEMLNTIDPKINRTVEMVQERFNLQVRQVSRKNFGKEILLFLKIYNESLQGTWGFVPLSDGEVKALGMSMKLLINPAATSVIEVDGEPVGVGLGLPDYNPIIKKIDGKLFPFGWIRILLDRKKITKMRIISANVTPEWQRWGLGLVLLNRMLPDVLAIGITDAEFSWVLETNHLSRGSLERAGLVPSKTYRLYDRTLSDI